MPRVKSKLKMLYLDIETTPHEGTFWSQFTKFIPLNQLRKPTYLLSWAAKWEGERDVKFRRHSADDCVTTIWELLDQADVVCHYNGKAFDIKHLNREFALAGLTPPSPYSQVDLLTTVRTNFKLASNKLDYVCQYFGLGTKVKHVGIELWYGCMEGNEDDWKIMEKYNKRDVTLLPKLYKFLRPWIKTHPNAGLVSSIDKPCCSTCGSSAVQSRGTYATKTSVYERFWCTNCGTWLRRRKQEKQTSENVLVRAN